jgi:hypothetical protein
MTKSQYFSIRRVRASRSKVSECPPGSLKAPSMIVEGAGM